MRRQKTLPLISLALIAALLVWALLFWNPETTPTTPEQPTGGDFTLQSLNGPLSLEDFRGKVVLLYFGYTSCPDVCPTSLALMRIALSQLSDEELAQVQGIFISVDPERDTPKRLTEYSTHFHPNISGITGTPEQVAEVAQRYGAIYQRTEGDTALGYTVDHSSITYVINQQGKLISTLPHGTMPTIILQEIHRLLNKP